MSKLWFTADTHFGHKRMLERRGFSGLAEHDTEIEYSIRDRLGADHTLYVLGDTSFRSASKTIELWKRIRERTQADVILIKGNHDRNLTRTQEREAYTDVQNYAEITIQDDECPQNRQLICLMHYPMESWRNANWGAWHLHGHWHGTGPARAGRLDVGWDVHRKPLSYKELKQLLPQRYGAAKGE